MRILYVGRCIVRHTGVLFNIGRNRKYQNSQFVEIELFGHVLLIQGRTRAERTMAIAKRVAARNRELLERLEDA